MQKRIIVIVFLAITIAATVIFLRSDDTSVGATKDQKDTPGERPAPPMGKLKWDSEIQHLTGRESLDTLRGKLLGLSKTEAVAEIEGFLSKGDDRITGLDLTIGTGGKLEGWPTLRVFLLDLLLEIDPAAAARISRGMLEDKTSPDEWSIALRNVAKGEGDTENKEYLRKKTEQLINNPEWQAQPSVGYLNAFDVLVYAGATESAPLLSSLVQRKDRRDLAHAGFLTLDRLVQRKPVEMLTLIQADLALQESRPEMTAQQFARADIRDGQQQAVVKSWLLDPSRTPTELRNFASTYPNNNRMISQNLLTSEDHVSGADLATHDREVLEIIRHWKTEPGFETLSPYLEIMDGRVSGFVKGADGSRR